MTLHVVGLPHTRLTDEFSWCAYTTKVARFAEMMVDGAGMEVITYGNGPAELPGKYVMVTDAQVDEHYIPDFSEEHPLFSAFNTKAIALIYEHLEPGDVLCLIGGISQSPIAHAIPSIPAVEFGIGYEGVFAQYRVWESYTWQSYVLGMNRWYGSEYDTVIYNYFDPGEFRIGARGDYVAFLGRVCWVKGVDIAVTAARAAGVPLKIAGHIFPDCEWVRELEGDIEYVGELEPAGRAELLAGARALIAPTRYVEPFGGVQVEAMLSGIPVIGPDYGAFTEFIEHTYNGWRCRSLADYVRWIAADAHVGPEEIRAQAEDRFSMWNIADHYATYFDRVAE
jgi:glycosyltransferase involved in cell wall biosynthesis